MRSSSSSSSLARFHQIARRSIGVHDTSIHPSIHRLHLPKSRRQASIASHPTPPLALSSHTDTNMCSTCMCTCRVNIGVVGGSVDLPSLHATYASACVYAPRAAERVCVRAYVAPAGARTQVRRVCVCVALRAIDQRARTHANLAQATTHVRRALRRYIRMHGCICRRP